MARAKPRRSDQLTVAEREQQRVALEFLAAGVTADRRRHDSVILDETMQAGIRVARVTSECIIDRYYHRMQINTRAWMAGIQLRKLWIRAVHPAAVTASYGEQRGSGGGAGTGIDARQILRSTFEGAGLARRFMPDAPALKLTEAGTEIWMERYPSTLTQAGQIAVDVCGMDEWAGGAQRLMLLREGLAALADYWKMTGDGDEDEIGQTAL